MQEQQGSSLLREDDWRGWLQQGPTQEFLGAIAEKKRWMEEQAGKGKYADPDNASRTQFENGVAVGYLRAVRMITEDILPPVVAGDMPGLMERLAGNSVTLTDPIATNHFRQASGNNSIFTAWDNLGVSIAIEQIVFPVSFKHRCAVAWNWLRGKGYRQCCWYRLSDRKDVISVLQVLRNSLTSNNS
jgi:hypothetical protein